MPGRMLILCALLLPAAKLADRIESDTWSGTIDTDWSKASGAVFTEQDSNVNVSEDTSNEAMKVWCALGYCSYCETCAACASESCAWVSDEEIYPRVLDKASDHDFQTLVERINRLGEEKKIAEVLNVTGLCIKNPKTASGFEFSDRYIVATKYVPSHELYTIQDPPFERTTDMIVLTGSNAEEACKKLEPAFERETKIVSQRLPAEEKRREEERAERERMEEEEKARKKDWNDRKQKEKMSVRDIWQFCAHGDARPSWFVSSSDLIEWGMFPGDMQRFGPANAYKDWEIVKGFARDIKDGEFGPNNQIRVGFWYNQDDDKVRLEIKDGRHRICSMTENRHVVVTEVIVNCGSVGLEHIDKLSKSDIIPTQEEKRNGKPEWRNAKGSCQRSKDIYDNHADNVKREQAKKEEADRKKKQNNMMMGGGMGGGMSGGMHHY